MTPPDAARRASPTMALRGAIWFGASLLLLAAAAWALAARHAELEQAWTAACAADAGLILAAVVLPGAAWLTTTGVFWTLTRRYAAVPPTEMGALIGAAWLLNYLPLRPGMLGRVAYHKAVHGIRVTDSAKVMLFAAAATGAASVLLLAAAWLCSLGGDARMSVVGIALPFAALGCLTSVLHGRRATLSGEKLAWRLAAALSLRYAEMITWSARYWVCFAIVGRPIDFLHAAAICAASQLAMLAPIQFGLREWIVGLCCALMERASPGDSTSFMQATTGGLMADLVNRAAELLVAVPVGLASGAHLGRLRTHRPTAPPADTQEPAELQSSNTSGPKAADQQNHGPAPAPCPPVDTLGERADGT